MPGFAGRMSEPATLDRHLHEGTPLIAVFRPGFRMDGLTATYGPEQLMEAWASTA
ncbi:hypothetical protein ACH5AO_20950 [Streptomyces sp. NPDC018964]|uniref:hypothetical protein n=1 Tax=unclassified Streptomyces TaxID=2593676 RepID=UPI0037B1FB83